MKIDSVRITSVCKTELTIYVIVTRDTEKCLLSVLPGACIKPVNFRENILSLLSGQMDVRIKRVSIEQASTV